ncbi:hypothetical protein PY365_15480 [Roseiarcaceae bacterium H3SJ34-1]|uniref:hypothetical protein n=1 Tax=Terripilifer ovatus TaxID=3032367 RepID=UPI003AB94EE1|nr:hypothetical protein [Roseiarcaceae bacterium H3SJ34-1]
MNRLARPAVGPLLVALLTTSGATTGQPLPEADGVEEIHILRSIREPATQEPEYCRPDRIGFAPFAADAERHFAFWSVQTDRTGKVIDARHARVATLRGCFGATDTPARQNFHADIALGDLTMTGRGECQALQLDVPEKGLFPVRCQLILSNLPVPYIGGLLTTNTITSAAAFGGQSDPPGYAQASIATIRLWKRRR